ncbi:collectin-11-like [Saccostrea cucullata]|uniref:collectin-11-like n=1 Tax=Saccostrea cuccullata TaxID=36930 RepID=UPI002ED4CEE1
MVTATYMSRKRRLGTMQRVNVKNTIRNWLKSKQSENSWLEETFLPIEDDCPSFWICLVWIGATDRDVEGKFVWDSDKCPVTFSAWYPGEPNNLLGDQDCVGLLISGQWDDRLCNESLGFVCEMDQLKST